ncbi:Wzz/FepE/Etk N-terminal domain-containing protein [Blastococcus atacamensis]|uniref:Wzz/FepE/Etk N-terminal domain-containing protein n=1 Tax=Blastococcus atacamensis TaxID=2070508 RepID=UPI000CEBE995|nr:Wzz/FepE/Etk N-terminal domain-containing protein [Blastococcus atacamensis]
MELRDYLAALRRYWTTWVGVTLAALLLALGVVVVSTPSYQATASVFVAATSGDATSGAQFIRQRVTSYPDVARSQAVLGTVIEEEELSETVSQLRLRISATNPLDSSQIDISVTDSDPVRAATIANAIAEEFGSTVEDLERPGTGGSPVDLTVTDPATVPSTPVFPVPALLLGLGLVVGLAIGAAIAVVRSRVDTRLHTEDDVRTAWGEGADELTVHPTPDRRRRSGQLSARPAALVARRLGSLADDRPVRAVVLSASPDDDEPARTLVQQIAEDLTSGGVPVEVAGPARGAKDRGATAGVQLATGQPQASLKEWRRIGREFDGVVLVAQAGHTDRADLQEIRSVLTAAGTRLFAVVLSPPRARRWTPDTAPEGIGQDPTPSRPAQPAGKSTALAGR